MLASMFGTSLIKAVAENNVDTVKKALSRDCTKINVQDKDNNTALIIASNVYNINIVKELLSWGADPNIQNKDGTTALMIAIKRNRLDVVQLLLGCGADPNIQNKDGYTALMISIGNKQTMQLLLQGGANYNVHNDGITAADIAFMRTGRSMSSVN